MRARMSLKQQKTQEDDDSDNQADDKSENSEDIDTDNSPKIIPVAKLPDKLKSKKIVINVSDTQYPIVEEIGEELGWLIQRKEGTGNWDIWWTDREIHPDTLIKMHFHQKINHYPGMEVLARKNLLGLNLMAMRQHFPQQYNFFPETWTIPLQFPKFRTFYESCPKGKTRTYIVKPEAMSQGRGIFLTRNIEEIANGNKYLVQRYIKNPYLLDGLKFDLRIYVLLAGTDPLRLYVYEEGLTRLATKRYEEPTEQNIHTSFIHLTNYSLNKSNPNFIYNTSAEHMDVGHKRTLSSTYTYLAKRGHDVDKLKTQINDLIIKTVIAGLPTIAHQYQGCQPEEYEGNMCFHILGVDVMLTTDLKPHLIEINHTPSFETSTPLDYKIKKALIMDTLKLMRITTKKKKELFEKAKTLLKKRIQTGKREIVKGEERKLYVKQAQQSRDQEEFDKKGGYLQIFPPPLSSDSSVEDNFNKMIERAQQVHKSTQEQRKRLIREEQDRLKKMRKNGDKEQKGVKKKAKKYHSVSFTDKSMSMTQSKALSQQPIAQILSKRPTREQSYSEYDKYEHIGMRNKKNNPISLEKQKKCLPALNSSIPKEEVIRFRDYMQRCLINASQKIGYSGSSLPDIAHLYSNLNLAMERTRQESIFRDDKSRGGNFVTPKMYNIDDSNECSIEKLSPMGVQKKGKLNPISSQCRHLRALEASKHLYRRKKEQLM